MTFEKLISNVAAELITVDYKEEAAIFHLPVLYPSGAQVKVHAIKKGQNINLSDLGSSYDEAIKYKFTNRLSTFAPKLAKRNGISFRDKEFYCKNVKEDELFKTIINVANSSAVAAHLSKAWVGNII